MAMRDQYDFEGLTNEAERLVIDELEKQLAVLESAPRTEEAVLDMAALALNNIRPFYHVSLLGKLYAQSMDNTEYAEKVRRAVRDAIRKVASNPPGA